LRNERLKLHELIALLSKPVTYAATSILISNETDYIHFSKKYFLKDYSLSNLLIYILKKFLMWYTFLAQEEIWILLVLTNMAVVQISPLVEKTFFFLQQILGKIDERISKKMFETRISSNGLVELNYSIFSLRMHRFHQHSL